MTTLSCQKSQERSSTNSSGASWDRTKWRAHLERAADLRSPICLISRTLKVRLEPFHERWIEFILERPRSLILAPRGHGKTTAITVGLTLWNALRNPDVRVCIVSNTQAQAESFLREIKLHLEANPLVTKLFGRQRGPKWAESEIIVSGAKKRRKEATVTALGVMGAVISRHFDLVILDDVVDEENARTQPQRDKLRSWFYTTLLPTLEPDGKLCIVGTRYHLRDLYGYLSGGPMRGDFIRYRALDDRGAPLWPGKFSAEFLSRAREEAGPIIFNAQYQNDVELMRGRLFREEWIARYDAAPQIQKVAIGVDLAIGQNSDNDYFALVAVGRAEDGKLYVLESSRGRYTFDEQAKMVSDAYSKYNKPDCPVVRVGIEATAYQEALPQRLRHETAMPVVSIRPAVDKVSRAHALTAFFETGRVLLKDDASQSALIEELLLFPEGAHDDLFDALEIAVSLSAESAGYRDVFHKCAPDLAP